MSRAPVRVLHILEATLGGTRRYLEDIGAAGSVAGIQMGLAYATKRADIQFAQALDRFRALGWLTYRVEMTRQLSALQDLRSVFQIQRVIAEFQPDIVHCHSSKAGGVGRLAVGLMRHSPAVIYSPHALAAHLGRRFLSIERALSRWTDRFVAVSESERHEIISLRVASPDRVSVVYPAIDVDSFAVRSRVASRGQIGVGEEPLVVGIGRLCYQKNPQAFFRIIGLLRRAIPNLRAIWVGDGELRLDVEAEITRAGLDGSAFVAGWQSDVRPYLAAADVMLSTSRYESFGYTTAEALTMGVPVVATAVTGTVDIMQGELAEWLFVPDDESAAAARIVCLLNEQVRACVGAIGRKHIERSFSVTNMARRLRDTYEQVVAKRLGR